MSEIVDTLINFMRDTNIPITWNGMTHNLTFWEIFIGSIVVEIGIFVVYKIMGD